MGLKKKKKKEELREGKKYIISLREIPKNSDRKSLQKYMII